MFSSILKKYHWITSTWALPWKTYSFGTWCAGWKSRSYTISLGVSCMSCMSSGYNLSGTVDTVICAQLSAGYTNRPRYLGHLGGSNSFELYWNPGQENSFFPLSPHPCFFSSIRIRDRATMSDASNISGDNFTWNRDAMDRYKAYETAFDPRTTEGGCKKITRTPYFAFVEMLSGNLSFGYRDELITPEGSQTWQQWPRNTFVKLSNVCDISDCVAKVSKLWLMKTPEFLVNSGQPWPKTLFQKNVRIITESEFSRSKISRPTCTMLYSRYDDVFHMQFFQVTWFSMCSMLFSPKLVATCWYKKRPLSSCHSPDIFGCKIVWCTLGGVHVWSTSVLQKSKCAIGVIIIYERQSSHHSRLHVHPRSSLMCKTLSG